MHQELWFQELPLQLSKPVKSTLQGYLPECTGDPTNADFPLQRPFNPYSGLLVHPSQAVLPASNTSISKWAFTEISTQDQKDEQSLLHLFHPEGSQEGKQQLITEATFKPHQLKQHLKENKESQAQEHLGGEKLRKLLTQNLKREEKSKKLGTEKRKKELEGKTKYQKILDEIFNRPPKNRLNSKMKFEQVEPIAQKYREKKQSQINELLYPLLPQEGNLFEAKSVKRQFPKQLPIFQEQSKNRMQPDHVRCSSIGEQTHQNWLAKTYSQRSLSQRGGMMAKRSQNLVTCQKKIGAASDREGWMKLTFGQRQKKTLQNRRQKQNIGLQLNKELQIQGCTFKPKTTEYQGRRRQQTASSYAKLYSQKIRRLA